MIIHAICGNLKSNCKPLQAMIAEENPGMTLKQALYSLAARPVDLVVRRWNWKAAFFSSLIRGIIFLLANLKSGWHAAVGAMLAEWCYRALTSGFYGAMTQTLGEIEPEWHGAVAAMILLPLSSHSLEFLMHWLRHTPHLKASIISSMSFTVVSTLFNFYAMRRGTMVVGGNSATFGQDMRALPRVIGAFLAVIPMWVARSLRSSEA